MPPAGKLPLIARKDIRDNYNEKIDELKQRIKEYLGEDYEFIVDFQEIYPKVDLNESYQAENPGTIAYRALESFVDQLASTTEKGDKKTSVDFFNQVVSSRKINIVITKECSSYSGCRVKDDVFEILFKEGSYGTNSGYACGDLEKELDKSFSANNKGALPLAAKKGYEDDFLAKKEKLEEEIFEELLDTKITLTYDPEEIWRVAVEQHDKLKRNEKEKIDLDHIARNMGAAPYAYFDGFLSMLKYKFKQDDMMVEAFNDECTAHEIKFIVVPQNPGLSKGRSYNDAIFEDGRLVIRTTPQNFYVNCSYATEDVEKLL